MINSIQAIGKISEVLLIIAAILIILSAALTISFNASTMHKRKKMRLAVEALLKEYVEKDIENNSLEKSLVPDYDYIFTTKDAKIYIMLVSNFTEGEICINAPTKWQVRRNYEDTSLHFVPRVDRLMRFEPPYEEGKKTKRLYIIYPATRSLLRYINECEMEFVRPTTDVNGTNVISYSELLDHKDFIDL